MLIGVVLRTKGQNIATNRHFIFPSEGRFHSARGVHSLALVALCFFLLAGCSKPAPPAASYSAAPVAHKTIGDLAMTLAASAPLHVGDNMFRITLADAVTQASISGATVTASAELLSPDTAGSSSAGKALGNGVYQVPIHLSAAGRYDINLHVTRPGVPATDISFPLQTTP